MHSLVGVLLAIFAFFPAPGCVAAEHAAGMIKLSKGQVDVQRGNVIVAGQPGLRLFQSDTIRTGAEGAVGITLKDGTLLSAGPATTISLNRFSFDTRTHAGRISVGVRKGTLAVATGKIAKQTPESVDFHTPTSVLGVRGTEFVIDVIGQQDD
jgi:hypothetical protein